MTDRMHVAVLRLQERKANLDHQWQRAIMLDLHGIFVYDERGPNGWRPHVRLFPDAKRRNDVEERSTLKRRRLLLETCDRPGLGTAPPPRVEAAASATSSHPNDYPDNRTPTPPRSRARPHPPEPEQEPPEQQAPGSWNGASRERALTKARPPEEPRQHTPRDRRSLNNTPTWPSWISHAASQHPTGPRGEPGQRNGWTLAPGDWPKESALREHRNILIRDHLQRGMTVAYRTSSTSTTSATSNPSSVTTC